MTARQNVPAIFYLGEDKNRATRAKSFIFKKPVARLTGKILILQQPSLQY